MNDEQKPPHQAPGDYLAWLRSMAGKPDEEQPAIGSACIQQPPGDDEPLIIHLAWSVQVLTVFTKYLAAQYQHLEDVVKAEQERTDILSDTVKSMATTIEAWHNERTRTVIVGGPPTVN